MTYIYDSAIVTVDWKMMITPLTNKLMDGWIRLTPKMRGEFEQREYHGDEFWNQTKRELDEMLAYRKTIKGKPDIYQMAMIELNAPFIRFYKKLLYGHELE